MSGTFLGPDTQIKSHFCLTLLFDVCEADCNLSLCLQVTFFASSLKNINLSVASHHEHLVSDSLQIIVHDVCVKFAWIPPGNSCFLLQSSKIQMKDWGNLVHYSVYLYMLTLGSDLSDLH